MGPSITEAIAGDLAKREGVLVIGYEAFLSLRKTHAETVESEGRVRPLSPTWLVTGGYQRLGDQLRITARIVDVESDVVRVGATGRRPVHTPGSDPGRAYRWQPLTRCSLPSSVGRQVVRKRNIRRAP